MLAIPVQSTEEQELLQTGLLLPGFLKRIRLLTRTGDRQPTYPDIPDQRSLPNRPTIVAQELIRAGVAVHPDHQSRFIHDHGLPVSRLTQDR